MESERYSTVVGQKAWERGKHSRLELFPQAFSVCIVTEVSLEAGTEQTSQVLWLRKDPRGFVGAVIWSDLSLCLSASVESAGKDSRLEKVWVDTHSSSQRQLDSRQKSSLQEDGLSACCLETPRHSVEVEMC